MLGRLCRHKGGEESSTTTGVSAQPDEQVQDIKTKMRASGEEEDGVDVDEVERWRLK